MCQINTYKRLLLGGLLHPLDMPQKKWESISMHFFIDFSKMNRGNDSVWVVVDRLTKMEKSIPTNKSVKTPKLGRLLSITFLPVVKDGIISRYPTYPPNPSSLGNDK